MDRCNRLFDISGYAGVFRPENAFAPGSSDCNRRSNRTPFAPGRRFLRRNVAGNSFMALRKWADLGNFAASAGPPEPPGDRKRRRPQLLEFCFLAGKYFCLFASSAVVAFAGFFRFAADAERGKQNPQKASADAVCFCRGTGADTGRVVRGSFTVEAALIVSLILAVIYFMIYLALREQKLVEQEALQLLLRPLRYEAGLRPEDLIYIGEFIQEWLPPR